MWKSSSAEGALRNAPEGSAMHLAYQQMRSRPEEEAFVTSTQSTLDLIAKDPTYIHFGGASAYYSFPQLTILSIKEEVMTSLCIALQSDSEFTDIINFYLSQLMQSGLLPKMRHKWLEKGHLEPLNEASEAANALGYDNLMFPFMSLLGGIFVASILLMFEYYKNILYRDCFNAII